MTKQNLLLSALLALMLVGCQATPKRIAFTTIDKTTDAVQEAVRGYGDYMRARLAYVVDTSNPLEARRAAMDEYRALFAQLPELNALYDDYCAVADQLTLVVGLPGNAPPTTQLLTIADAILNITNRILQ